jgi:hypothetical protein
MSKLEDLCAVLDEIRRDTQQMAQHLETKKHALTAAAARARTVLGQDPNTAQTARHTAQALDTAARACAAAVTQLQQTGEHAKKYISTNCGNGTDGSPSDNGGGGGGGSGGQTGIGPAGGGRSQLTGPHPAPDEIHSSGITGSGFTAAQTQFHQAEQHLDKTTQAVDNAHQGTRATAQADQDTDTTGAASPSKVYTTTHPPTPHTTDTTSSGGGASPPTPPYRPPGASADDAGSWRGERGLSLTPRQNAAANEFLDRARRAEPEITCSTQAISDSLPTSQLVGLDYRLKTEDSFKHKLATEIANKPEYSLAEHLSNMKDSVRYTMRIPDGSYTAGVVQAVLALHDQGYESVKFKPRWEDEDYRGINSMWRDPRTGHVFEVQFHTPDSFDAKMSTHGLYEQQRLPGLDPETVRSLRQQQQDIFSRVPVPPGALDIKERLPRWVKYG